MNSTVALPLAAGYQVAAGVYDEMSDESGALRPVGDPYVNAINGFGTEELARRWRTARQRVRENGVTYNVYGDPLGMDRPWNLDAIPLWISPHEWRGMGAGVS